MKKALIFGNSGAGKSTLAKAMSVRYQVAHLDLDQLAWLDTVPPKRQLLHNSAKEIQAFIQKNPGWVIEGCYTDLLEYTAPYADEAIFLNLPVELCTENAKRRPWEPHKYPSKEAQDDNLSMLLVWIADYYTRDDAFSLKAHLAFYHQFSRNKQILTSNTVAP